MPCYLVYLLFTSHCLELSQESAVHANESSSTHLALELSIGSPEGPKLALQGHIGVSPRDVLSQSPDDPDTEAWTLSSLVTSMTGPLPSRTASRSRASVAHRGRDFSPIDNPRCHSLHFYTLFYLFQSNMCVYLKSQKFVVASVAQ